MCRWRPLWCGETLTSNAGQGAPSHLMARNIPIEPEVCKLITPSKIIWRLGKISYVVRYYSNDHEGIQVILCCQGCRARTGSAAGASPERLDSMGNSSPRL